MLIHHGILPTVHAQVAGGAYVENAEDPGAHVPRDVNTKVPVAREADDTSCNPSNTRSHFGRYHKKRNVVVRAVQVGFRAARLMSSIRAQGD